MQSQNKHNNRIVKLTDKYEDVLGKLSKQVVTKKTEVNDLQDRTRNVETELRKITNSFQVCRENRA
jgi:uncharacterized coiled-coil protein SlyX